jgi:hypoxanthine-DNA glycosylase
MSDAQYTHVVHEFEPIYDCRSRILILGSLPSVKSRENNFYYGNPQNRFWRVIARLTDCEIPETIEEKTALLLKNRIALWDVISECDIIGSSDSSIKNPVPADLSAILEVSPIERIYANGSTAAKYYRRFQKNIICREITVLPSTSPANAAWSFDRLCSAWSVIVS